MKKRIIFIDFINTFSTKSRKYFLLSILLGILNALGELAFVFSFTLILNPDLNFFNNSNSGSMPPAQIISLIILIVFTIFLRFLFLCLMPALSSSVGNQLSKQAIRNILNSDFDEFLENDISEYIATLTMHASRIIGGFLIPINNLISSLLTTFLILFFVGSRNLSAALLGSSLLIIFYALLIFCSRNFMKTLSERRKMDVFKINSILNETFNNYQQVFTYSKQENYINEYSKFNYRLQNDNMLVGVIGNLPKLIFESSILLIFLITLYLSKNIQESIFLFLPFFIAAYRLLPNVNTIYSSWTSLNSNIGSIDVILKYAKRKNYSLNKRGKIYSNINFILSPHDHNFLIADKISYKFPRKNDYLFEDSSFVIKSGENYRINGRSGIGKSTLITILAGLRNPTKGKIIFNSNMPNSIDEGLIGYVDQFPKLFKGDLYSNIKSNIANKKESEMIDFLINKFNLRHIIKYAELGEQGAKISGGERQRIAIARCLMRKDKLLLLDEISSSLDSESLKAVQEVLLSLSWKCSIIFTSHNPQFNLLCKNELWLKEKKWVIE